MASTTIRKAINKLKNQTTITLTILTSTKHNYKPITENHTQPCIAAISRRLAKTRSWQVALKSLVLLHRLPSPFPLPLSLSSFKHKSWDYSALIRAYTSYLNLRMHSSGPTPNALDRAKHLQQVLDGFLACRPIGRAKRDLLVAALLYTVVKESFRLYADLCGMLDLLMDGFLEMGWDECAEVLVVFGDAARQVEELRGFYGWCGEMGVAGSDEFPEVEGISDGVLEMMERRVLLMQHVVEGDLIDLGEDVGAPLLIDWVCGDVGDAIEDVGEDPFAASLSFAPPCYGLMGEVNREEMMMMGEMELWH